jgi:hypothetical protein
MATLEITGAAAKASAVAGGALAEPMLGKANAEKIDPVISPISPVLFMHASNETRLQYVSR